MKISSAQFERLRAISDEWEKVPFFFDSRPISVLIRKKLIEIRKFDVTPADWGTTPVRVVREEWRRTDAGRAALEAHT